MRILVKDENDNMMILESINGFIPPGLTLVAEEDKEAAEISIAKASKMSNIRSQRDVLLIQNDTAWLIASKKGEDTSTLEAEAQELRDLPESAQEALDELETLEEILAYDPFEG